MMEQVYAMLKLFGERYVFCDDEQAKADAEPECREDLIAAYVAIMDFAKLKGGATE